MRLRPTAPRNLAHHASRLHDPHDHRDPLQLTARGGMGADQGARRAPALDVWSAIRLPALPDASDAPGLHGLSVPLRHAPPVAVTGR